MKIGLYLGEKRREICSCHDIWSLKLTGRYILYQTDDKKLQKKILTEYLSYDDAVKFGLAMEQNTKKVDNIRGASESREEVTFLKEGGRSGVSQGGWNKHSVQTMRNMPYSYYIAKMKRISTLNQVFQPIDQ